MADYKKNFFQIEGTIFGKPSRKITSKKDGKEYEFKAIILELKREYKGKTYYDFPEFQLGYGVADDGFAVGDYVQISFSLVGKKVNDNFHKTELKAIYIKHPDMNYNDTRDVGGDVYPNKNKIEPAPVPMDDDDNDLPF
jgi:hypothetical protein